MDASSSNNQLAISHQRLLQEHQQLKLDYTALELEKKSLQLELLKFKKMLFGKSTERFIGADLSNQPKQGVLLDVSAIAEVISTSIATVTYSKTSSHTLPVQTGRQPLPSHLRREQIVLQPNDVRVDELKKISDDITETLAYTPAELYVKRTIRPKYLDPGTQRIVHLLKAFNYLFRIAKDNLLLCRPLMMIAQLSDKRFFCRI